MAIQNSPAALELLELSEDLEVLEDPEVLGALEVQVLEG